jgi:hypothetical protein
METVVQREYILKPNINLLLPGFSNRSSMNENTFYNQPYRDRLKLETNHIKREMKRNFNRIMPLLEYQVTFSTPATNTTTIYLFNIIMFVI